MVINYLWRSELGKVMMADSCGIFMCVPAVCTPLFKENALDAKDLHSLGVNGGPGCSLDSFLPRTDNLTAKLQPTFTAVAVENKGKGGGPPGLAVEDEAQNKGKGGGKGKLAAPDGCQQKDQVKDGPQMTCGFCHKTGH